MTYHFSTWLKSVLPHATFFLDSFSCPLNDSCLSLSHINTSTYLIEGKCTATRWFYMLDQAMPSVSLKVALISYQIAQTPNL